MILVKNLERLGYRIFLREGKICYEYLGKNRPDPNVVEPLILGLREHKEEVIDYLRFAEANMAIKVKSNVLDKEVYFVSNEKMRGKVADEGFVAYLSFELMHLIKLGATPEELKKIHMVKEIFPGSKIPWN